MSRAGLSERAGLKFLSTILGLLCMAFVTAPWQRAWNHTPTEEPWMYLVVPQAVAVLVLRSRRPLAWVGLGAGLLLCWPRLSNLRWPEPWIWHVTDRLSNAFDNPVLGRALLWMVAIAACAIVVRAATRVEWGTAFARAAMGMVGSLAVSEALLWLRAFWSLRARTSDNSIELLIFLVPAMVLPGLLWPNWNRVATWAGASAASVTLTAILVFDLHHLTPGTAAVAAITMSIGPVWAYLDWRRSRVAERARGFEVMVPPTIPVS
jgi:hypothetical protein